MNFPSMDSDTARVLTETRLGLIWLTRLARILLEVWMASEESPFKIWLGFIANLLYYLRLRIQPRSDRAKLPMYDWLIHRHDVLLGGLRRFTGIRQPKT
jgi:hypothetical protein